MSPVLVPVPLAGIERAPNLKEKRLFNEKVVHIPTGTMAPVFAPVPLAGIERALNIKTILKIGSFLCPHGDSNPGFSLERATSWSPRRWGRSFKRMKFYHPFNNRSRLQMMKSRGKIVKIPTICPDIKRTCPGDLLQCQDIFIHQPIN